MRQEWKQVNVRPVAFQRFADFREEVKRGNWDFFEELLDCWAKYGRPCQACASGSPGGLPAPDDTVVFPVKHGRPRKGKTEDVDRKSVV